MGSQGFQDFKITGLVAAPFTPFTDQEELALDRIDQYAEHLLANGVNNIYICGTTGEGPSLTLNERKQVAEKWVQIGKGRFRAIIVQVGSGNLKEIEELASHAESIGADAISTIPTIFFKPASVDIIADFLQRVSNAAPTLPLYYYHNPDMTGVKFSLHSIMNVVGSVKTLRGAKFTSSNLFDLGQCMSACGQQFQFLYAMDEQLLPSLTLGVEGCVGSTYNYLGNVGNRLLQAYYKGDMESARKEQFHINDVVNVLIKYGPNVATNKAIANLCGLNLGPARHPLLYPSEKTTQQMRLDLETIDFFNFIR